MDRTLILDGIKVSEYDLYYASMPPIPTPEQDIEYIKIRGRHGSLTKKYGYNDINYPIELYFYENTSFKKAFRLCKQFLLKTKTLSFTDDEEVYYKVKSLKIDTAENDVYKFGRFEIIFTLDPFQYEVDNDPITITNQTTIMNEGYESEPIITATMSGTGKIYINNQEITIQNINGTITIDSEMQNAYRLQAGSVMNLNKHMIGKFPVLEHGNNNVSFDGDISQLKIICNRRWL